MRFRPLLPLMALVLAAPPASAVITIDWLTLDSLGTRQISKEKITNAQYSEFLNVVSYPHRPPQEHQPWG